MRRIKIGWEILYKYYIIEKKSMREIGEIFRCADSIIKDYIKEYGIPIRGVKKYINTMNFLDSWTYEMAYIVGFLIGDGNICKRNLSIGIHPRDKKVLEFIKRYLSPERPIHYYNLFPCSFKESENLYYKYCHKLIKTSNPTARLTISGLAQNEIKRLNELAIFPRKSCREYLPKTPDKFVWCLLRGYFDADGCIYKSGKNSYMLIFSAGGPQILEQVQQLCFGYGNIYRLKNRKAYDLHIYKKQHIKNIAKLMYQNDCFSLKRKKDRFISYGLI